MKGEHRVFVALGRRRIGMRFEEQTVAAGGDCGPRQDGDELPLPSGGVAVSSWKLHRVGGIEADGVAERLHDRDHAHVGH